MFLMCSTTEAKSSELEAQYVLGVFRSCPPRPLKLKTTQRALRLPLATLTKLFMYSDWESPVSPGRNNTMGALSATSPSGDIQSRPTSPPSNSL